MVTQGEGLPKYTDTAALALIVGHEVMQHIAQVLRKSEQKVIGSYEKVAHSVDTPGRGFDLQGRLQQVPTMIKTDIYGINLKTYFSNLSKIRFEIYLE